jgi:adenylate cyclase
MVNKFIVDSVMAFWGAPDPQPNHATWACRAANAIALDLRAENERRRSNGEQILHLRIGLHSGPATVGNIGTPGRMNYTPVGDTVNVSPRLEQLCKWVYKIDDEVNIIVSDVTRERAGSEFSTDPAGTYGLTGRSEKIAVFRLLQG